MSKISPSLSHPLDQALRESEERFRLLVQSIKDYAIFMLDPDGRVSSWNLGAQRAKGYAADEIIGKYFTCFYTPEDIASGKPQELLRIAKENGRVEVEGWRVRKDGSRFWADVILTVVNNPEGKHIGFAKITRDVTERKTSEDALRAKETEIVQLQKIETLGRLAGGIAHDFNNLLAGILGCTEEISRELKEHPEIVKEDVVEIAKACERGQSLIRQLMAFSRRQISTPSAANLNDVILGMKQLIQRSLGSGIILKLDLDPDLSIINIDVSQIEQILLNLAINSRDAMPHGGSLTIRTRNSVVDVFTALEGFPGRPARAVQLTVADSGTGMSKETQAKIFEPFFTTKPLGQGTGLGLATVYGIVQQHKGGIAVYSSPDLGTTFKIFLPIYDSSGGTEDQKVDTSVPAESVPQGTELILVVDDDALVLRTTVRNLQSRGYTVLGAGSVVEAKELFAKTQNKIRLVLTDIIMPMESGKQLTDGFLRENPQLKVLFMSGYEAETIATHGIVHGKVDLIEKPFSGDSLARKIREMLDRPTSH